MTLGGRGAAAAATSRKAAKVRMIHKTELLFFMPHPRMREWVIDALSIEDFQLIFNAQ
jgi:hypothetical protein